MNHRQLVGKFGENLAKKYLIARGYKIIENNLKINYQEIDIIAKKDQIIVFVEVKTRLFLGWGSADEAINDRKIKNMLKAVEVYIDLNNIDGGSIRLDLISVDIFKQSKKANIKHYKDII